MDDKPLPNARIDSIVGLLEVLLEGPPTIDIFHLSQRLRLPSDDLLPIVDAARMLGFVDERAGHITLTRIGRAMARARILERKDIFRRQVLDIPLMHQVIQLMARQPSRRLSKSWLMRWLGATLSELWVARTIDILVDWGRYAELIGYNARTGELYLPTDVEERLVTHPPEADSD